MGEPIGRGGKHIGCGVSTHEPIGRGVSTHKPIGQGVLTQRGITPKGFDDAWLCLKEEARIAFDEEERCHRHHLAALLKCLRHCQEAGAQAAVSAVLLLAEDRRHHEAPELATHMRSLAAS